MPKRNLRRAREDRQFIEWMASHAEPKSRTPAEYEKARRFVRTLRGWEDFFRSPILYIGRAIVHLLRWVIIVGGVTFLVGTPEGREFAGQVATWVGQVKDYMAANLEAANAN